MKGRPRKERTIISHHFITVSHAYEVIVEIRNGRLYQDFKVQVCNEKADIFFGHLDLAKD